MDVGLARYFFASFPEVFVAKRGAKPRYGEIEPFSGVFPVKKNQGKKKSLSFALLSGTHSPATQRSGEHVTSDDSRTIPASRVPNAKRGEQMRAYLKIPPWQ
jgi:hypothetical protein